MITIVEQSLSGGPSWTLAGQANSMGLDVKNPHTLRLPKPDAKMCGSLWIC